MLGLALLGGRLTLCAYRNRHSAQRSATWVHNIAFEQDRVRLALELETSGLAGLRLSGMGGEIPSLVTEFDRQRVTR